MDAHKHGVKRAEWSQQDITTDGYYNTLQFSKEYIGNNGSEVLPFVQSSICFEGYKYDDAYWKVDQNRPIFGLYFMIWSQITQGMQKCIKNSKLFLEEEVWTKPKVEFCSCLSLDREKLFAIENIYFNYILCLTTASKTYDRLLQDCNSGQIYFLEVTKIASLILDSRLLLNHPKPLPS